MPQMLDRVTLRVPERMLKDIYLENQDEDEDDEEGAERVGLDEEAMSETQAK